MSGSIRNIDLIIYYSLRFEVNSFHSSTRLRGTDTGKCLIIYHWVHESISDPDPFFIIHLKISSLDESKHGWAMDNTMIYKRNKTSLFTGCPTNQFMLLILYCFLNSEPMILTECDFLLHVVTTVRSKRTHYSFNNDDGWKPVLKMIFFVYHRISLQERTSNLLMVFSYI